MPSLNMNGPYKLDTKTIEEQVTKTSSGNYALGRKKKNGKFGIGYVGRSDTDVKKRLKRWVSDKIRPLFKFSYATSPKAAFEKECQNYHDFKPPENDVHPQRPDNTNWKCPHCTKFD